MDFIEEAFRHIPRHKFLPEEVHESAHLDRALPIGFDQTNSQPTTVEYMLRWLEVEPGDIVLDIGSGSGWTSALLAHIVGKYGKVYAVEKIPELVDFGRQNCARLNIKNVTFFAATSEPGLPPYAPYDRILVSATAPEVPTTLINQLKPEGKLVIPIRHDVLEIMKSTTNELIISKHPGFTFVPLV